HEAGFDSGQRLVTGTNACAPGGSCGPMFACHPIIIGVDTTPGFAFGKGDSLGGSTGIRTGIDDNANRFVTYGDTIAFKLSVANSAVSALNDVVMIDRAPAGTTFSSATLPASANGSIWYYTGAATETPPAFFANPASPADDSLVAGWTTTRPAAVTWVAFWIPRLRSAYFNDADPASVIADFNVRVDDTGQVCQTATVDNVAWARFARYTPLGGAESAIGGGGLSAQDHEPVAVKPVLPNLAASNLQGPSSIDPGETGVWTVNVLNLDPSGNQVDTARAVSARIAIPQITANGVPRYLDVVGVNAGGGAVTYALPGEITVTWPTILPNQAKAVALSLGVPLGVKNATAMSVSAALSAQDDHACAPITAAPSKQTTITSAPALEVRKDVDLTVVAPGTTYNYALRYTNHGTAPSSKTWIVDRLPDGVTVLSASAPETAEIWFSSQGPPFNAGAPTTGGLPTKLLASFPFDDAVVRAHFTRGTATVAPGVVQAPAGAKWVAFLVDDPAFSPAILGVGGAGLLGVEVQVSPTAAVGTVLQNEALIVSDELLQSIGNQVVTTVSARPGLSLEKSCPEVISTGEPFTYRIDWVNDTTNQDDVVTIIDTLPLGFVPELGAVASSPAIASTATEMLEDGRMRVTWSFPVQPSLDVAWLEIPGEFVGVTSGTFATNDAVGIAENDTGAYSASQSCTTLVSNPDLFVRKLVDVADPRSGEAVTFTLSVSNENARRAEGVVVTDTMPAGLAYVGGSLAVRTPGWTLTSAPPAAGATSFTVTLQKAGVAAGEIPGSSGAVVLTYGASVGAAVVPGTTLENTVAVTTTTGEDAGFPNSATASVTTPLPDPYLTKTGPLLVKPGEGVTWKLTYGNGAREDATGVVIVDTFPEGPVADDRADFAFVAASAPAGVSAVWYSSAPLSAPPAVASPAAPGAGWTATPGAVVNHVLFVVGDLDALSGPFGITITAEARAPDGNLPSAGGTFEACAHIEMIGANYPDEDSTNNEGCVTTRTPGVDLAVTAACTPSGPSPGLPPGDVAELAVDVENTGTVNAYGVEVDATLAAALTLASHTASDVVVTRPGGEVTGPVDVSGERVAFPVTWTATGTSFVLGQTTDESRPDYYTKLGLSPGDHVAITVRARVADATPDSTAFSSDVAVTVAGRPGDEAEEILVNNADSCGAWVYRADPFVVKAVENTTGNPALAEAGDVLRYTLTYGNSGNFPASGVVIADDLPAGTSYVGGSLAGVPLGAVGELDDGSLAWALGDVDGARSLRVRWEDGAALPAPANATFSATSVADFELGVFDGTAAIAPGRVVLDNNATSTAMFEVPGASTIPYTMISTGERVVQFAVNPAYLQGFDGPTTITGIDFEKLDAGFVSLDAADVSLAYVADGVAPTEPGQPWQLHPAFADNVRPGTEVEVYDGPIVAYPVTGLGAITVPFAEPFEYDPAAGALLITLYMSGETAAASVAAYAGGANAPIDVGAWGFAASFETPEGESFGPLVPRMRFSTDKGVTGVYESPTFPGADEGNVVRWGRVVASSTLTEGEDGAADDVAIDVVTPDGDVVLEDVVPDGTGAYDLSAVSAAEHPSLKLRARLTASTASCTQEVRPDDASEFYGVGMDISDNELVVGVTVDGNVQRPATAFAWTADRGYFDLTTTVPAVAEFDPASPDSPFQEIAPTSVNESGLIAGYGVTNPDGIPLDESCGVDYAPANATLVVPSVVRDRAGNTSSSVYLRAQNFYVGSYFGTPDGLLPVTIRSLRLRTDGGNATQTGTWGGLRVSMGYGVTSASTTFAANYTSEPVVVYEGDVTFDVALGNATTWDIEIP
ncbi:MAG: DUF11 domain-containing protein, partial [Myxococcales bacterium]|nr:DUF11 domain-containing protein [Myxococcales bacterium]